MKSFEVCVFHKVTKYNVDKLVYSFDKSVLFCKGSEVFVCVVVLVVCSVLIKTGPVLKTVLKQLKKRY